MKEGFRQSMSWLHTWIGLVAGWVLYFVYLTGTLGYLDKEIDYWMTPDRPAFVQPGTPQQQVQVAQDHLQQVAPQAASWNIQLIGGREAPSLDVSWTDRVQGAAAGSAEGPMAAARPVTHKETLDPRTGKPVDYNARATGGGQVLYKMHYQLAYIPYDKAILVIMVFTLIMFAAMVTGIIVHKNIFKDFFTFRPGKGQRSWLDGHNFLSVTALPFHLIVTYSGFLFFTYQFMPSVPHLVYGDGRQAGLAFYQGTYPYPSPTLPQATHVGAPLVSFAPMLDAADQSWGKDNISAVEVRNPGDANARVLVKPQETVSIPFPENMLVFDGANGRLLQDFRPGHHGPGTTDHVMKGLHKGLFANWWLRILLLFMGVGGTAMIGTGLLLWANTRRTRLLAAKQPLHFGIWLVDRLNVGAIIGMPIAIAAYFWANRLLPVELATRANWEVHAMYLTMAAMFAWPMVRPYERVRIEMLWLCAAAYGLLPVLNMLTTTRGLNHSIAQGDWIMAGFDLTALGCAAFAAWCAVRARRSMANVTLRRRPRAAAVAEPVAS
ncbi:MAG: PepSY-associated TM helix domain-containing protein [Pseudomonadota bacterium]